MQKTILWTGREYYSLEHCSVITEAAATLVDSTIIGYYQQKIYKLVYQVHIDMDWKVREASFDFYHDKKRRQLQLKTDATGGWTLNDKPEPLFDGCLDIDIPLTPFTNTLPIRRLALKPNDTHEIAVIYCNLLEASITPVRQKYTCISSTQYHYENVPNDFEATIEVDADGLVVDYPMLFTRTAAELI